MRTFITILMCLGTLAPLRANDPPAYRPVPAEPAHLATIGSGLIFVSLIASSTRKRKSSPRSLE